MYTAWYNILIGKIFRIASGKVRASEKRRVLSQGQLSPLEQVDACLQSWAQCLHMTLTREAANNWTENQLEDVYRKLYSLANAIFLSRYIDRADRQIFVKDVVR